MKPCINLCAVFQTSFSAKVDDIDSMNYVPARTTCKKELHCTLRQYISEGFFAHYIAIQIFLTRCMNEILQTPQLCVVNTCNCLIRNI